MHDNETKVRRVIDGVKYDIRILDDEIRVYDESTGVIHDITDLAP